MKSCRNAFLITPARNRELYAAIEQAAGMQVDAAYQRAAMTAAAVMGMNKLCQRFLHLVEDAEYRGMPARLRMNAIANPGVPQGDFGLLSFAVSTINGCGPIHRDGAGGLIFLALPAGQRHGYKKRTRAIS